MEAGVTARTSRALASAASRSGLDSMNQVSEPHFARFAARACLPGDASLRQVVEAVQAIPYGRPGLRTAEGVISEWKGTCSTKHALLARLLRERSFPAGQPWDGHQSMNLACGDGRDFPAGDDPDADKAALEASYCDPLVREPFIAALTLASQSAGRHNAQSAAWENRCGRDSRRHNNHPV